MSPVEPERTQRFDALFASYGSDVVAYCGWRAGSASDAQDAASEVFLTAWRRLDDVPEAAQQPGNTVAQVPYPRNAQMLEASDNP